MLLWSPSMPSQWGIGNTRTLRRYGIELNSICTMVLWKCLVATHLHWACSFLFLLACLIWPQQSTSCMGYTSRQQSSSHSGIRHSVVKTLQRQHWHLPQLDPCGGNTPGLGARAAQEYSSWHERIYTLWWQSQLVRCGPFCVLQVVFGGGCSVCIERPLAT